MFLRLSRFWIFLLGCLLLSACGDAQGKAAPAATAKSSEDHFAIKVGEQVVRMRLAVRPGEMQKGLMHVKTMPEMDGMLFVYPRPTPQSFWMRNTELALDIGFFDADGTLREIYPMYPHDERQVKSTAPRKYALEMNQGWFARNGVKAGAKLDLAAVAKAMGERGFKVMEFGLARE